MPYDLGRLASRWFGVALGLAMHADAPPSSHSAPFGGHPIRTTTRAAPGGPEVAGALPGGVALTLAATTDAPQLARRAVASALASWEQDRREAALLVISELVTNAVRYGASDRDDRISLRVRRRGRTTRIEVTDPRARAGEIAETIVSGGQQRSGWGLPIVAELTDRWGVERGPGRTCIWCELDER